MVLEATITPEGCVSSAEVLQSVAPDLDISAMRAVTGWTFMNDTPVPVIMTVSVLFVLK